MDDLQEPVGLSEGGPTWAELLGSHNWAGLLDPLNDELRRLIIRCGDFCQVTYDTFINDPNSAYCGCSRYAKSNLLASTAFPGGSHKYDVVGFLYATARVSVPEAFLLKSMSRERWDRESNWVGYIAVSNNEESREMGRREVYVAFRGTTRRYEWIDVLGAKLQSAMPLMSEEGLHAEHGDDDNDNDDDNNNVDKDDDDDDEDVDDDSEGDEHRLPKVMKGWLTIYTSNDPKSPFTKLSARSQLLNKINQIIDQYKDNEDLSIIFTGHSLGATLSVLSAFDIAQNLTTEIPISAIIFGCPKVGNKSFKNKVESHPNLKILHVRNVIDTIPHYPTRLTGYTHVGTELEIDSRKSPFLKNSKHVGDWHNLQGMLHIVNGWQGFKDEFRLVIRRSIALVNKSCDYLKEECLVPPSWWVEKNKGMVLNEDGDWVLVGPEEDPVPEFD